MLKATVKMEKEEKTAEITSVQRLNAGVPKVAFSVALHTLTKIIFKCVYTNIGNTYNPTTGTFTAPVRGD